MNPVDSELEEGEILDDSPSSPCLSDKKHRELPRRYVVHEKSSPIHKHKKDCKYAIHYHAKKLSKLKKTPKSKDKRHRKSICSHERSHKFPDRSTYVEKNFSKNHHSFSKHSLIAEMEGSVKSKLLKNQKYMPKSEKNTSETENKKTVDFNTLEADRENTNSQIENNSPLNNSKHYEQPLNDLENLIKVNTRNEMVSCNEASDSSSKLKNEESEDEEELRRIALATCAKRKVLTQSENLIQNVDTNFVVSVPTSSGMDMQISHETSSPLSDNYEVVDMDVDEDIQASIEILENSGKEQNSEFVENLFVIDTKPSEEFEEKKDEKFDLKSMHNSSDDDFEADILRAELIESLYRKKCLQDECVEEQKSAADINLKRVPVLPKKKHVGNFKKSNVSFFNKRPGKHILRKTIINKTGKLHCNKLLESAKAKQLPPIQIKPSSPIQTHKPSERIVIALNDESSSEDDSESENPVASIEALISDCRQKSESSETKIQEVLPVTNVPKAVSCLSKAQQEEYTSLVKILAKKEKTQVASDSTFQHKNGSVRTSFDDLELIKGKLADVKETLRKKKVMMEYLLKDINLKKALYMKSKLTAQHLKEQYIAAEKIKKANLGVWSKSCSDFKNVKKTVSNLETKINNLQNLYSKVSASIQTQT